MFNFQASSEFLPLFLSDLILNSNATQILIAFQVNFSMLARNVLQVVGSLVLMFTLNPALTGVLLAVVPIVAMGAVQYGR